MFPRFLLASYRPGSLFLLFLAFVTGTMLLFAPRTVTITPGVPEEPRVTRIGWGGPIVYREWSDRKEREIRWAPVLMSVLAALAIAGAGEALVRLFAGRNRT